MFHSCFPDSVEGEACVAMTGYSEKTNQEPEDSCFNREEPKLRNFTGKEKVTPAELKVGFLSVGLGQNKIPMT